MPANYSTGIVGSLETFDLRQPPNYEAISYTWGQDLTTEEITVNGCTLHIRTNLYLALARVRHVDRDRLVWVDAICIRQDHVHEKNQQ